MFLSPTAQSVMYAVITKSVSSGFRIKDDWRAPLAVKSKTMEREAVLLGLTTVFTTAIQHLFTKTLSGMLKKNPRLAGLELIFRTILTAPALIVAEIASRKMAPKPKWDKHPLLSSPAPINPFVQTALRQSPKPIAVSTHTQGVHQGKVAPVLPPRLQNVAFPQQVPVPRNESFR